MNIFILEIEEYLKQNQYFKTIKNISVFAVKLWETYHSKCNIVEELKKADFWVTVNENRRKKRYDRFLCNWFGRK